MLRTLLETRAPRSRDRRSATASVVVHAGVIAAAVVATATADAHPARPERTTSVVFAPPPARAPAPTIGVTHTASTTTLAVPTSRAVASVTVEIPTTLPDIGVRLESPGEPGPLPATGSSTTEGSSTTPSNGVWSEHTVEKPVIPLGDGARPRYPDLLRSAGVEGEVLAQFVVDTIGQVEPGSIRVLRSAHALFTQAVERALPQARFIPAEAGGRRVRQLVQQPFAFAIAK